MQKFLHKAGEIRSLRTSRFSSEFWLILALRIQVRRIPRLDAPHDDAPVERDRVPLDVETFAILVRPGRADLTPTRALAVARHLPKAVRRTGTAGLRRLGIGFRLRLPGGLRGLLHVILLGFRVAHSNRCPSARLGVQAEQAPSRGTGCTERSGGSWAEGASQRAGGEAPSCGRDRHRSGDDRLRAHAPRARAEGNTKGRI